MPRHSKAMRTRGWMAAALTVALTVALAVILSLALNAHVVLAQGGATMTYTTIDGGGGRMTGGNMQLTGTVAQHDAGELHGGNFTLIGGIWAPLKVSPTGKTDKYIVNMPFVSSRQPASK